ncbi:MAG: hypothetical protein OEZ14_12310 [Acidimicrobiia bacterium]|nr:hypothetical protein [Acidimicrobiia bacterium]
MHRCSSVGQCIDHVDAPADRAEPARTLRSMADRLKPRARSSLRKQTPLRRDAAPTTNLSYSMVAAMNRY